MISLSCLLHYFLWENFCLHHLCSSICNVFFFFSFWMLLRKIFSLLLVLTSLITMHLDVILFMFSCIWVSLNFLDLWSYSFCQMWNNFCHYLFKYYFCPPLSLSGTPIAHKLDCLKLSYTALFIILSFLFPLHFILNRLYCYAFKFTNNFFCSVSYAINLILWNI